MGYVMYPIVPIGMMFVWVRQRQVRYLFSRIMHLLITLVTQSNNSNYCAKRHQHWFRLTSGQLTALTWTLSTTASGGHF